MAAPRSLRYPQLGILAAAVVLLVIFAVAVRTVREFQAASEEVLGAQDVRLHMAGLVARMKEVNTAAKSYLVNGDERLLATRAQSMTEFGRDVASLRKLTAANPEEQLALQTLEDRANRLNTLLDSYFETRRTGGATAVQARVAGDREFKQLTEELRLAYVALDEGEKKKIETLMASVRANADLTFKMLVGGLALAVGLVAAVLVTLRREFQRREQAAQVAEEARRYAESIVDTMHQPLLILTHDLKVNSANRPFYQTFRLTPEETIGRPLAEICGGVLAIPGLLEALAGVVPKHQELTDFKVTPESPGQGPKVMLVNARKLYRAGNGTTMLLLALEDITERQRAETMIEEARQYAESIVDTVREPLLILTHDLKVNSANWPFYDTFCLSAEETIGRPLAEISGGVWAIPELQEALSVIVPQHEELKDFKVTAEFPGLGKKVMLLNARKLYRVGNGTTMMLLAIEDITERDRFEAALQHERYLLGELMDNATECIYFKDAECRFTRINRGLAARFGLTNPADAIGKSDFDFYTKEHAQPAFDDEQQVMRTGQPVTKEERETWPDGHVSWVLTVKLPLRDAAGKIVGTYGLSRDITDRKNDEAQLEALNESLRIRSGELESVNRELEAFSYSVSHDLRAPLRHIDYFAAALEKQLPPDQLDAKAKRHLAAISSSARGMGQLIDDLLSFARISRTELKRSRVRLDELVAETRQSLARDTEGRNIAWDVTALPEVEGDPSLLRQVFANLLSNAVKYTRKRPEARIEIAPHGQQNGEITVRVSDNGAGFDMKYADKLFGVFQRLHSNKDFEGTGVGLANVRRIVERHGGRIWAEAEVDRGATFYFTLPTGAKHKTHS